MPRQPPPPPTLPRVVIGAGRSRSLIRSAVAYADEINVYADDELIRFARQEIKASSRAVTLSAFVWDWLQDIAGKIVDWGKLGAERTLTTFRQPSDHLAPPTKLLSLI